MLVEFEAEIELLVTEVILEVVVVELVVEAF